MMHGRLSGHPERRASKGMFTIISVLLIVALEQAQAAAITFVPPYYGGWCDHSGLAIGAGWSEHDCSVDEDIGYGEVRFDIGGGALGAAEGGGWSKIGDLWTMAPECTRANIDMTVHYIGSVQMYLVSILGCARGLLSVNISLKVQDITAGVTEVYSESLEVWSENHPLLCGVPESPSIVDVSETLDEYVSFSATVTLEAQHSYLWSLYGEISGEVETALGATAYSNVLLTTFVENVIVQFPDSPLNDTCADATSVVADGAYAGTNVCTATDGLAPCGSGGDFDVWWKYVAPLTQNVTIDTCGSDFDTILSVHDTCGASDSIACNDDDCGAQSSVDLDVTAGSAYYIRVAGFGGDVGNIVLNISTCAALGAPTGVAATDGTYCDKVRVTWSGVAGVGYYKVYRDGIRIGGDILGMSYNDESATPGTTYSYSVKTHGDCGDSESSASNNGSRGTAPTAPTGVAATDGTYCDKVRVTWNGVSGASFYKVYRDGSRVGGDIDGTRYDDESAAEGVSYSYTVKGHNNCGDSASGNSGVGLRFCDACDDRGGDDDDDGVCNDVDNCPDVLNADQSDCDADGLGDECDQSPAPPEDCGDLVDNDCDELIDALDPDCDDVGDGDHYHAADQGHAWEGDCTCATCEDWQIEMCEAIGYAAAWKRGDHDNMAAAMRGLYIWIQAESYHWDESESNWMPGAAE